MMRGMLQGEHNVGRRRFLSPILDQICHGGSSVSMRLAALKGVEKDWRLFRSEPLNQTVIFKYPNFTEDLTAQSFAPSNQHDAMTGIPLGAISMSPDASVTMRPIETAIYVPMDPSDLGAGGYAIYLRQRDFERLIKDHCGLDYDETSSEYERDVSVLKALDQIPSLDPFLLKGALSFCVDALDPRYFDISREEEAIVRLAIATKLKPIVARAFQLCDSADITARTDAFLKSIWGDSSRNAAFFLHAFQIEDGSNTARVIEGWKGIEFYRFQFQTLFRKAAAAIEWLSSNRSFPGGVRQRRHDLQKHEDQKTQITRKIKVIVSRARKIFQTYDAAHTDIVENGRPAAFANFLRDAERLFWLLGYSAMAIRNVNTLLERALGPELDRVLSFEDLDDLLWRLNACVSSQVKGL